MTAKIQEGLIGANSALNTIRTPMKVFKEARARGDRETMDRAMGYVSDLNEDAWEHKHSADEGLRQEAEENKLNAEKAREELAQRIEENKDRLEERIQGDGGLQTVTELNAENGGEAADTSTASVSGADGSGKTEDSSVPVTYDSSGKISAEAEIRFNVVV